MVDTRAGSIRSAFRRSRSAKVHVSFACRACWLIAPFFANGSGLVGRSQERSSSAMCDFSLHNVKSRPAKVGDKLTTHNFSTGTCGFAAPEDSTTAVCILPGTELAFSAEVIYASRVYGWKTRTISSRTAIFRQINKDVPQAHHDALEFPDGTFRTCMRVSRQRCFSFRHSRRR